MRLPSRGHEVYPSAGCRFDPFACRGHRCSSFGSKRRDIFAFADEAAFFLFLVALVAFTLLGWMSSSGCRSLPFLRTCGVFRIRSHPPRLRSCPHLHLSQVPSSTLSTSSDRFTRVALRSTTKVSAVG